MSKQNSQSKSGFTLMELLVVLAIMVIVATILIINYNRQRGIRNLRIAQNELITNIRKTQSFILSSRNTPTGQSAKFYIVRLGIASSGTPPVNTIYRVQNIDTNYTFNDPEQNTLPQGIVISGITVSQGGGAATAVQCVQLMFSSPFGKLYTYSRTSDNNCGSIVVSGNIVQNPSQLLALADARVTITLQDSKSLATRTVVIYGVSGKVEAGP